MKCAGRAVTLQFMGQRPDIAADKPGGVDSPEYEAFEQAGPNEVMVLASVGPWESVGGDIKFLRLKQLEVGGLVTDGSVRDTDTLLEYGFPVYSYSTTPRQVRPSAGLCNPQGPGSRGTPMCESFGVSL